MQSQSVLFTSFLTSTVWSCDVASNLTPRSRHEASPASTQQGTAERTMLAARTQPGTESPLGSLQGKAKAHLCWGPHKGWQRKRQNVAHRQRPHSHETQMQSASKIPSPHTAARTSLVLAPETTTTNTAKQFKTPTLAISSSPMLAARVSRLGSKRLHEEVRFSRDKAVPRKHADCCCLQLE